jgi:hypothetical protein
VLHAENVTNGAVMKPAVRSSDKGLSEIEAIVRREVESRLNQARHAALEEVYNALK